MTGLSGLGSCAVLAAGFAAGTLNAVIGAGSLITFPTLLAVGFPPLVANVSNTVGLVPGSMSAVVGYRRELSGARPVLRALAPWSVAGAASGAALLLVLPSGVFAKAVPVLVLGAVGLLAAGPRLSARLDRRGRGRSDAGSTLKVSVFFAAIYGGYFGAAQGVILIALLGLLLPMSLQQANAVKNALALLVNGVAAVAFVLVAHVAWQPALLIAFGSTAGGQVGARYGRRLSSPALRRVVVTFGVIVGFVLLVQHRG